MSHPTDPLLLNVLQRNERWATDVQKAHPDFFKNGNKGQSPKVERVSSQPRCPEQLTFPTHRFFG